jgi:hypothetical protein
MRGRNDYTKRPRARHSWARGAFLRLEVGALVLVAVCVAILSASRQPERIDIQLTGGGGSLTLSNTKEGAAVLSLGGIKPGDSITDTVTLGNTGTLPGDLSLDTSNLVDVPGSGGGALSGKLDLRVRDITNAGSPVTVYAGKIAGLTPVALGTLAAGDSRLYEFKVDFPDTGAGAENAYQGSGMSVRFDWTAVNNDADTDPPQTTITAGPTGLTANPNPSFSFSSDETGSTFECSLDAVAFAACSSPAAYSGLADGDHTFSVRATDTSANTDATPAARSWTIDATAPTASLADPGSPVRATVSLSPSADDGTGSGVASLIVQRSPAGAGTWTTIGTNWNTTSVADGSYDLRARAIDNAGNAANSALRTVTVDNTAPSLSSSVPADGEVLAAAGLLTVVATEDVSGIANATIDGSPAPVPVVAGPSVAYTDVFADGPHTLAGDLTDLAGNSTPIRVHFTVWSLAAADYPWVEANSFPSTLTSLDAANGDAIINVPTGAWSGAPAGDWLVVRIDPRPPAAVASGFQTAGDVYDVTAYWALDGGAVHTFDQPLELTVLTGAANTVPATFENGSWRAIAPLSGQTLPAGQNDGYYKVGQDVHVLTRHLSSFTLLKDVQAPSKPKSFSGSKSGTHLVLKWKAATDNSGLIDAYLVYAKGTLVKTLSGAARSADMGLYKLSDKRSFRVAARDVAGNVGPKTAGLVIVPSVAKLTLTDAKARLVGRGLKSGTISYAFSASVPSGRVISAGRSGLVPLGTAVPLTVSRGVFRSATYFPVPPATTGSFTNPTPYSPAPSSPGGTLRAYSSGGTASGSNGGSSAGSETPPPAGSAGVETANPESFSGDSNDGVSGLRRFLGLALLGGAFATTGGLALRARGRRIPARAALPGSLDESLLFWDQRFARATAATVRRFTGRI